MRTNDRNQNEEDNKTRQANEMNEIYDRRLGQPKEVSPLSHTFTAALSLP